MSHLCVFSAENANNSGVSLGLLHLLPKQTPPLLVASEYQSNASARFPHAAVMKICQRDALVQVYKEGKKISEHVAQETGTGSFQKVG